MQNKSTRRGNTQKNRVGQALPDNALAKGHSPFLEKGNNPSYCQVKPDLHKLIAYRLGVSPTGVASAPENIRCKAGKLSGSHPTYEEEALNKDSFKAPLRCGFTLIELLVVVLIIGILSAVAVPQYQFAVEKSRYVQQIIVVDALFKGAQLYYLQNDEWPTGSEKLQAMDITMASCNSWFMKDVFTINCNVRLDYDVKTRKVAKYCQAKNTNTADINFCKKYTGLQSQTKTTGDTLLFLLP